MLAVFVAGLFAVPTAAQEQGAAAPPNEGASPPLAVEAAPPASTPILVLRQSALFSDSLAARSIASQAAEAERALDAELDQAGESLRTREHDLSDQRSTLPKAEFDELAAAFERDVRAFYARSQRERGLVDQAVKRARADLRRAAQDVLIEIMRRHGALVMLDENQVVLSKNSLDITQEAIERLNQSVPDVRLDLSKPDAASDP